MEDDEEKQASAAPDRLLDGSAEGGVSTLAGAFQSGLTPLNVTQDLPSKTNEASDLITSEDEFSFDALIEGGDIPSPTIKAEDFGSIASFVDTFEGFEPATTDIASGVYEFGIEENTLRLLVTITGHAVHGTGTMGWVELRLQDGRLRARSFNRDLFAECSVDLLDPPRTSEDFVPVAVAHEELATALAGIALDARLRIDGPGKTLTIRSHGFERPIRLQDASKFVAPTPAEIGHTDLESRRSIPRELLREALAYLAPFANPDQMKESCGYVELREGRLHSSTSTAIAHVWSSAFPDWVARIPSRALRVLARVFDQFPDDVELLTTGRFLILLTKDLKFSIGIGNAQPAPDHDAKFAIVSHPAPDEGRDRILAPRSPLLRGVMAQRALGVLQTRWLCVGTGNKARSEFRASNADGKGVVFSIGVSRQDGMDMQRYADLPIPELVASMQRDASQHASLDLYWGAHQMRVAGPELEGAVAETIITVSLPKKVK